MKIPEQLMMPTRRIVIGGLFSPFILTASATPAKPAPAMQLIAAAREQIGVTLVYDPAYRTMAFPGGDVPPERGVCTDVIIRAYRKAFGFDLQREVNADMQRARSAYPHRWGVKGTDRNIDHRRVPNLMVFFTRKDAALPLSGSGADYMPGDVVSQMLPGNLPHIAIVSDRLTAGSHRPLLIHNIGAGAREEDTLLSFEHTGHYRFFPR